MINVGDYVRTKSGIKQIYEIDNNKTVWKYKFKLKKQDGDGCVDLGCFSDKDVIKSSPNIIDLIEVGDYVNGDLVTFVGKDSISVKWYKDEVDWLEVEDIISIVTKEQFKSIQYEVE